MATPPHRYDHVAWCYDALAWAYSLGAIDRAKRAHLDLIRPGDRVLYVGAGTGREIVGACERGAVVTCIEPCPAMADRLRRRLRGFHERATIRSSTIQSVPLEPAYDMVVSHFFLNVFGQADMPGILDRLGACVKPGGRLVIADFKPASSQASCLDGIVKSTYYWPVNVAGYLLGICDLHPMYDYGPALIDRGFAIVSRSSVCGPAWVDVLYEVIVARL